MRCFQSWSNWEVAMTSPLPPPLPNTPTAGIGTLLGEFRVTPFGAAEYTIPIDVPPGRAGIQPKITILYNSMFGNGPLGHGFKLTGLSMIDRVPQTFGRDRKRVPVYFNDNDALSLDGARLVLVAGENLTEGAEYRTELDSFSRITYGNFLGNDG